MLPAEHPDSDHRNIIGLQRSLVMQYLGRKVSELYIEGYISEADELLDELVQRRASWTNEGGA